MKTAIAHVKFRLLIFLSIVLLAAILSSVDVSPCGQSSAASSPVKVGEAQKSTRFAALIGRWQRTDGGYVIEIKEVSLNGTMDAAYFNPNPIHVAKAQATLTGEELKVFVELRDVNYPGSTYNLTYDPVADRLNGTYYQAVARETYRVLFIRVKP